ncbi:MAG: TIGR00730 family Rossman fold protein [Bacteroidota bacterium]
MKSIAVYCGSSSGINGIYREQAGKLGELLAKKKIHVVFGGGKVGLMGVLADAVLEAGGQITGVIPSFLKIKEVAHEQLSELIVVDSLHERKALISNMTDGAIALPGGLGTLDELFEMLTWGQLGLHAKPVGLLNTNQYFSPVLTAIEKMIREGFLKERNREMVLVSEEMEELLQKMNAYKAPVFPKWILDA